MVSATPPHPGHMGDLTFIKSNAPAQLARLGVNITGQMTLLDPVLKIILNGLWCTLFYCSKQTKERAFAFIGINRDTKCYIFNMFFFLYSSSFVFYLKCKLVRVDVPFVFKVLSDFRYRSATMS